MKLSDKKIIDIWAKSPINSFSAMLDTLRYLDGNWTWEEVEYELFDKALCDNIHNKTEIKIPNIKGITANALFAFTKHAEVHHLIRRRTRKDQDVQMEPDELLVFYELTPNGKEMIRLLEAIETVT